MKTLRIIIAALFLVIASSVMAQVTVSTSQLNGTKWKIKGTSSGSVYEYSTSQRIWHRNDGSSFTYLYYLTQLLPFELFSKKFCLKISELGFEIV